MSVQYHWQKLIEADRRSKEIDEGGQRPIVYVVWAQGRAFIMGYHVESQHRQKETELQPAVEALCGIPPDKQIVGWLAGIDEDQLNVRFSRINEEGKKVGFNLLLSEKDLVWVV